MVLPAGSGTTVERNIVCDNGTYYLVCAQAGEQLLLHFDTGNVKCQLSSRYFARFQSHVETEGGDVERSRSGGFGGVVWNDVRTLPRVELQVGSKSVTLHQVAVDMTDGSALMNYDGAVGVDLLTASERVSFDLEKMYYRIDR